jgi:hypothetical protein
MGDRIGERGVVDEDVNTAESRLDLSGETPHVTDRTDVGALRLDVKALVPEAPDCGRELTGVPAVHDDAGPAPGHPASDRESDPATGSGDEDGSSHIFLVNHRPCGLHGR